MTEENEKGAKVNTVMDNTAAQKAGLQTDDIITAVGTKTIKNPQELSEAIRAYKPGDVVAISYLRKGKAGKTNATLGKTPNTYAFRFDNDLDKITREFRIDPPVAAIAPRFRWNEDMIFYQSDRPKFGMNVQDNEAGEGVLVNEVEEGTNAAKAGLQKGDIITSIDGKPTPTLSELRKVLRESMNKTNVPIGLMRGGSNKQLDLRIPKRIESAEL